MSDYRVYKALEEEVRRDRRENREQAEAGFPAARKLAAANGLSLRRYDDTLYQLRSDRGWLLNVYPGNQRLYSPKDRTPEAPILWAIHERQAAWTLLDVVMAAIRADSDATSQTNST